MLRGFCKKCGKKYYGWALKEPEHRLCDCGGEIEVATTPLPRKEVVTCDTCGSTYDDKESIEQVKEWLKAGYAPCPNISCSGHMEVFQDGSKLIYAG